LQALNNKGLEINKTEQTLSVEASHRPQSLDQIETRCLINMNIRRESTKLTRPRLCLHI
jgi:hypothetical protein